MHNASDNMKQLTAYLFRENAGKISAVLTSKYGLDKIDAVMDIVQDTFEAALTSWRYKGVPDNPGGWLMKVAQNKALNVLKKDSKFLHVPDSSFSQPLEENLDDVESESFETGKSYDSQLWLLKACCYPALSTKNQIIITLHIFCGFGVPEIASALLMKNEAVKKSVTRARSVLKEQYRDLIARNKAYPIQSGSVLTILYLMFNEGYKTTRGKAGINYDLCYEAMRLAKLLLRDDQYPEQEVCAMLALMFFTVSRYPARLGESHEWLSLEEQDRTMWAKPLIEEGFHYLEKAALCHQLNRYYLEALVASLHASAIDFRATEWNKIAMLYRQLETIEPSPGVKLNRIIAESFESPFKSIRDLDYFEQIGHNTALHHFYVAMAKADIYRRVGTVHKAREYYNRALILAQSQSDQIFIKKRIQKFSQS